MVNIAEIKRRAGILDVWAASGGPELRGNRGPAFWRQGTGYNVALDAQRGLWHDFVTGDGGDVITLVQTVRQCSFLEAVEWLARHTGVAVSTWIRRAEDTTNWREDLEAATWWRITAVVLAEDTLASLSSYDPDRRSLTALLQTVRLGDAALVEEYRQWRKRLPQLTADMTRAGQRSDARIQRRLALWIAGGMSA